jgi:hypothetical protein
MSSRSGPALRAVSGAGVPLSTAFLPGLPRGAVPDLPPRAARRFEEVLQPDDRPTPELASGFG